MKTHTNKCPPEVLATRLSRAPIERSARQLDCDANPPCKPRRFGKSRVGSTATGAAIAAAPLFMAEADLHAVVFHYDEETYKQRLWTFAIWDDFIAPASKGSFAASFTFSVYPADRMHIWGGLFFRFALTTSDYHGVMQPLNLGDQVDGDLNIPKSMSAGTFPSVDMEPTYYGFAITGPDDVSLILADRNNHPPTDSYYGWMQISTSSARGNGSMTIHQWALESQANTPIRVGTVPEPADFALGLGALAAGAATVLRKRRKECAA